VAVDVSKLKDGYCWYVCTSQLSVRGHPQTEPLLLRHKHNSIAAALLGNQRTNVSCIGCAMSLMATPLMHCVGFSAAGVSHTRRNAPSAPPAGRTALGRFPLAARPASRGLIDVRRARLSTRAARTVAVRFGSTHLRADFALDTRVYRPYENHSFAADCSCARDTDSPWSGGTSG
jgi:hypothetical protein